jgi:hypothetical protein
VAVGMDVVRPLAVGVNIRLRWKGDGNQLLNISPRMQRVTSD